NDIDIHKGLLSRYLNGEKPSLEFIYKTIEIFPELDLNYMFKEELNENLVNETPAPIYKKGENPAALIEEIEENLKRLKKKMTQKSINNIDNQHNKCYMVVPHRPQKGSYIMCEPFFMVFIK